MRFAFILFSLASFTVFGNVEDSLRSEKGPEGVFVIHEVEEKETLFSLARRYHSAVDVIIESNDLEDHRIDVGQVLRILVIEELKIPLEAFDFEEKIEGVHIVREGETLYGISKKYGLKLKELKKLNGLSDNYISFGQKLMVKEGVTLKETAPQPVVPKESAQNVDEKKEETETSLMENLAAIDYKKYFVEAGETLRSIAKELNVTVDNLKDWNDLTSDYLNIGQELLFKNDEPQKKEMKKGEDTKVTNEKREKEKEKSVIVIKEEKKEKEKSGIDEKGFEKIYETGIAAELEDVSTTKYLALHRHLPVGTVLMVRNLMNGLMAHVKIVGRLPDTGINNGILLRISSPAYDQLKILDPKARVEVSYYKN